MLLLGLYFSGNKPGPGLYAGFGLRDAKLAVYLIAGEGRRRGSLRIGHRAWCSFHSALFCRGSMVKSNIDRGLFVQPLRLTGVLLAWNLAKFCRRGMCQYAGFGGFYLALACVFGGDKCT